ncbi:response regulator [Gallaecimonas xiamenensis]|uniref:DNA-binding dual transcriptional regulator OmpR n=1 Tax=Gallaecimonas xiamenensis 3-C-1 TaxID=745411 RepID=K2JJ38_9GAMM|nr:response regulator [Gallaecimonas xiamenensis]EKE70574.1 transcriptional regulatory protein BaeR [Gallaecimonas xiamenensis 3-C-1]
METNKKVLIVEDELKIAALLMEYFQAAGFDCVHLDRGDTVMTCFMEQEFDLVLLDLMLPGVDGLEVCRRIRALSMVPIMMLSARTDEVDRLLGLELQADDYVCKPFSPREVVARARGLLRRTQGQWHCDRVVLDNHSYQVRHGQSAIALTKVEFELLRILYQQPGRIYSRGQLMNAMYRDYRVVAERTVDSHVKKLRKKLKDLMPEHELIQSVYGVGYKYEQLR